MQDTSIINALQGYPAPMYTSSNGFTVFVPTNDAFSSLSSSPDFNKLRNTLGNLVIRNYLSLDKLRSMSGTNFSSTLGYNYPHLYPRVVKNFYRRPLNSTLNPSTTINQVNVNNTSIYNQFVSMYGLSPGSSYNGPAISTKFSQDELFLVNDGILLDFFACSNGIIYMISTYPQYYDYSALNLLKSGLIPSLTQSTKYAFIFSPL